VTGYASLDRLIDFVAFMYEQKRACIRADMSRDEAAFGAALIENFRSFPVLPSADERISACILGVE
jgi:hypothetical protein